MIYRSFYENKVPTLGVRVYVDKNQVWLSELQVLLGLRLKVSVFNTQSRKIVYM